MDEKDLLLQAQKGNVQAFEKLVTRYEKSVFSIVYSRIRNYDDAREISQEVFLRAYQKLGSIDPSRSFFSWLAKVAINRAYEVLRERKGIHEEAIMEDMEYISVGNQEDLSLDDKILLLNSLDKLGDKDRTLLLMKYFEDYSMEEIAKMMQMGLSAVKVAVMRAKERLLQVIEEGGDE